MNNVLVVLSFRHFKVVKIFSLSLSDLYVTTRNEKNQEELLKQKGLFSILLHINSIVALTINNTKIYNNLYNT